MTAWSRSDFVLPDGVRIPTHSSGLLGFRTLRQLPIIKIPAMRVLSYPFRAMVFARSPKSLGGHDERTEGTAHCHDQGRGPETDRGQEKGVASPRRFGLPSMGVLGEQKPCVAGPIGRCSWDGTHCGPASPVWTILPPAAIAQPQSNGHSWPKIGGPWRNPRAKLIPRFHPRCAPHG